jgi:hypothetical protein
MAKLVLAIRMSGNTVLIFIGLLPVIAVSPQPDGCKPVLDQQAPGFIPSRWELSVIPHTFHQISSVGFHRISLDR